MSDKELTKWCEDHLSTSRKCVNANYTRDNFKYLKKKFPNMWEKIKNKNIKIKNKFFTFKEVKYEPIIINGIIYKTGGRCDKKNIDKIFKEYILKNPKYTLKGLIKEISINKKISGFRFMRFIKKCYKNEYDIIMNKYFEDDQTERETIYRYLYDIEIRPKINGIPLKLTTIENGYLGIKLYNALKNINDEYEIVKTIVNMKYDSNGSLDLKKYFPNIYDKLKNKYQHLKIPKHQYLYMYVNDLDEIPLCLECKKRKVKSGSSYGFYTFCTLRCARKYRSKINKTILWEKIKNNNITDKDLYMNIVDFYTDISWKVYANIINPNNLKRKFLGYHLDHVIAKNYGFIHNIDPKVVGHYKNLQMLTHSDNCKKQDKLFLTKKEYNELMNTINESGFEYYEKYLIKE